VTMRHLMAHRAGFEDRLLRNFRRDPDEVLPLALALVREMPSRVRPPGEVGAYSNYGSALAALVVEEVAAQPWEQVIEDRILQALNLTSTTVEQPPADELGGRIAVGYGLQRGRLVPKPFEVTAAVPAGGASASASDMLRFAQAHLEGPGLRLFAPATRTLMHSTLDSPAPGLPGMAHGFFLSDWGGRRVLSHNGDLLFTHCGLYLVPEERFALFVAFNSFDGGRARNDLTAALSQALFPPGEPGPELPRTSEVPDRYAGWYRPLRRAETTVDRILELLGHVRVEAAGSGQILTVPIVGEAAVWRETSPGVFRNIRSQGQLVFVQAPDGGLRLFPAGRTVLGWEQADWFETAPFHAVLLVSCVLVLLTPLAFPVIDLLMELRSDQLLGRRAPTQTPARFLSALVALLLLGFLGWITWQLIDPTLLIYDLPEPMGWMLVLPLAGALLAIAQTIVTVTAWRAGYWNLWSRLHFTLTTAAALALTWQLAYWNFLGWNY
jgi:hypothetical protein